jgi:hypothetical protein
MIRTEASLGIDFKRENLKALSSKLLCKNRSEFGYTWWRIFLTMEGPVSSNLLAPPTKHTTILDRPNSLFNEVDALRFTSSKLGGAIEE